MNPGENPNRERLVAVATAIAPMLDEIVFVGGQVTELLVTDPAAVRGRPTHDIDLIVPITTRLEYQKLEGRLRKLGLSNVVRDDAPICRWQTREGYYVDVMPVEEAVLGFSNRWYRMAMRRSVHVFLTDDLSIRVPRAPVFLATKWDAYFDRGSDDVLGSSDLEDIITLVAGRLELLQEIHDEAPDLRDWIGASSREFLASADATYAIQGALPDAGSLPDYLAVILGRFESLAAARG